VIGGRKVGIPGSDRGVYTVHMPFSTNLYDLRQMAHFCNALTPFEVAFYGGIPALIYSIKQGQFDPKIRVKNLCKQYTGVGNLTSFLKLALSGQPDLELSLFDRFATVADTADLQFPICYIHALLVVRFEQYSFSDLYEQMQTYGTTMGSGLDWEAVVHYAVMLRCILGCNSELEKGPFNILPMNAKPQFMFVQVPGEITTVDELIDYVTELCTRCSQPALLMVVSKFASFPIFDGFVWYHVPTETATAESARKIIGYQCKKGKAGTNCAVPDSIHSAVLLRGAAPPRTRVRGDKWEYWDISTIKRFVGTSLLPLVPKNWENTA
jgi:hypothetical protein